MASEAIAAFCARHRAVSTSQLSELFCMERSWASRCAGKLVKQGKISCKTLQGRMGRPISIFGNSRSRSRKFEHIRHTLLRTQILINFTSAARADGNTHLDYCLEHELSERVNPVPDAVLMLERLGSASLACVEADLGTETIASSISTVRDLVGKIRSYAAFLDGAGCKAYEREFARHFNGLRVLLITTSWPRIQTLEQRLANRGEDFGFVWATTISDATSNAILTKPIWKSLGHPCRRAILNSTKLAQKPEPRNSQELALLGHSAGNTQLVATPNNTDNHVS